MKATQIYGADTTYFTVQASTNNFPVPLQRQRKTPMFITDVILIINVTIKTREVIVSTVDIVLKMNSNLENLMIKFDDDASSGEMGEIYTFKYICK